MNKLLKCKCSVQNFIFIRSSCYAYEVAGGMWFPFPCAHNFPMPTNNRKKNIEHGRDFIILPYIRSLKLT